MKRFISLIAASLVLASTAFATPTNTDKLMGTGLPDATAKMIDALYATALTTTRTPATDNAIDLGSASKQFRSLYLGTSLVIGNSGSATLGTSSTLSLGSSSTLALGASSSQTMASGAQIVWSGAPVITPATTYPTPSAGNTLSNRRTILAAGAPTLAAVVLPLPTVAIGKTFTLYNQGSNPALIAPNTGAVINVDAALTPFSCPTLKECECENTLAAGTSWWCTAR